jgi:hypothetical protein
MNSLVWSGGKFSQNNDKFHARHNTIRNKVEQGPLFQIQTWSKQFKRHYPLLHAQYFKGQVFFARTWILNLTRLRTTLVSYNSKKA